MRRGAAGLAAAVLLGGCGSGDGGKAAKATGPLAWRGTPKAFGLGTLPTDHIVTGRLVDRDAAFLRMVAKDDLHVVGADGKALPTTATFNQTPGHSLFDPTRLPPSRLPEGELVRIGDVVRLHRGQSTLVTIAWRETPGGPRGARIRYPGGVLPIPPQGKGPTPGGQ